MDTHLIQAEAFNFCDCLDSEILREGHSKLTYMNVRYLKSLLTTNQIIIHLQVLAMHSILHFKFYIYFKC